MTEDDGRINCYRCSTCSLNWPFMTEYSICPKCETALRTFRVKPEEAMGRTEAASLSKYYAFIRHYENEHIPCERLDPLLEARIDQHVREVKEAHAMKVSHGESDFTRLVNGQFDSEAMSRIVALEKLIAQRVMPDP